MTISSGRCASNGSGPKAGGKRQQRSDSDKHEPNSQGNYNTRFYPTEESKPSSTKNKKKILFNATQKVQSKIDAANESVKHSKKQFKQKSSARSSRSNSHKKLPMGHYPMAKRGIDTKKLLKQQILKNNFIGEAYDGDVSSVYYPQ